MEKIRATARAKVWGTSRAWSLAPNESKEAPYTECMVNLVIQGTKKNGYHLIMSPEGYFAADNWYESKKDAFESAYELFGVTEGEWGCL